MNAAWIQSRGREEIDQQDFPLYFDPIFFSQDCQGATAWSSFYIVWRGHYFGMENMYHDVTIVYFPVLKELLFVDSI